MAEFFHRSVNVNVDQELALTRCFVFTHQVAAVFCRKWRHDRHLENVTSNPKFDSVNRYVFSWRTFLPIFIPMRFERLECCRIFWRGRPKKKKKKMNKMSCGMRSVP